MTSMPRKAISPSNAPSIRTPPEPLIEPCQITPAPSTDVIRSTACTGCCVSAGVVFRLNIWRLFYLERVDRYKRKQVGRYSTRQKRKRHESPPNSVSTCVPFHLFTPLLPLDF